MPLFMLYSTLLNGDKYVPSSLELTDMWLVHLTCNPLSRVIYLDMLQLLATARYIATPLSWCMNPIHADSSRGT